MKTKIPSKLHHTLGLSLVLLLAMAGAAYAPAAQATLTCVAHTPRVEVNQAWSAPLNYYEVPVGGTLSRKRIRINNRLSKTGIDTEYMAIHWSSSVPTDRTINAIPIPGADGLAIRAVTSRGVIFEGGTFSNPDNYRFDLPQQNVLYTHDVEFQIVRALESVPVGTSWSIGANTPLPQPLTIAFIGIPQIIDTTNCRPVNLTTFAHIGLTGFQLTSSPAPITCDLTINNENNHAIDFGVIRLEDLHTIGQPPQGFAKRPIDVHYTCHNTSTTATPGYRLGWHGTAATGVTTALQVTDPNNGNRVKNGLGVVMEVDTTPPLRLPINTTGNNRIAAPNAGHENGNTVRLYAYPIRTDNSQITSGPFRANATVRIDLF